MKSSHLLVDYAGVVSTIQPEGAMAEMAALTALPVAEFEDRYWRFRIAYDRGCKADEYWNKVVERDEPIGPELLQSLATIDTASWTHINSKVVETLRGARAAGMRLTLLSNAPPELSDAIENVESIADIFSAFLFSARLGLVKPDAEIFAKALSLTGTTASETLFIDDRSENIEAARALGFQVHHFTDATRLAERILIS